MEVVPVNPVERMYAIVVIFSGLVTGMASRDGERWVGGPHLKHVAGLGPWIIQPMTSFCPSPMGEFAQSPSGVAGTDVQLVTSQC